MMLEDVHTPARALPGDPRPRAGLSPFPLAALGESGAGAAENFQFWEQIQTLARRSSPRRDIEIPSFGGGSRSRPESVGT